MDNLWTWLVVEPCPSEKYEFVNWGDDAPNIWKIMFKMFQTTSNHQPDCQHDFPISTLELGGV